MEYTPKQYVEIFHLLFLKHLESKLDKNLYALKGGANLRFFLKSIRYSEDMDFDIKTIAKDTLRIKITKLLSSQSFEHILFSRGIKITHISQAKQTDTTQRWKLTLEVANSSFPLPTKIEFSRRAMVGETIFSPIDMDLIRTYQLYPTLINHYTPEAAFHQKILALISRTQTQARDIFDLKLLMDLKVDIKSIPVPTKIKEAIDNIKSIGFPEFKSQVVAYLMSEYQEYYHSKHRWETIQAQVIQVLQGM